VSSGSKTLIAHLVVAGFGFFPNEPSANAFPGWNKSSRGAFTTALLREKTMQAAIDRVMQTYCLIEKLTDEEAQAAREKVSSYLAEKPEADEHALAIEGLRYLRSVRE
jgi:hypothetical protein